MHKTQERERKKEWRKVSAFERRGMGFGFAFSRDALSFFPPFIVG